MGCGLLSLETWVSTGASPAAWGSFIAPTGPDLRPSRPTGQHSRPAGRKPTFPSSPSRGRCRPASSTMEVPRHPADPRRPQRARPRRSVSQSVGRSVSQSVNQCAGSAGRGSAQLCSTAACKTGEDESFVCTLKGDLTSAYTSHGAVDEPNSRPCALLLLSSEIPPVRLCRLGPCTHRVRGAVASLW